MDEQMAAERAPRSRPARLFSQVSTFAMTLLRTRFPTLVLAVLLIGGLALTGCDSGGTDAPDPETFTVTVENAVEEPTPVLKSGAFTPADVINPADPNMPPLQGGESFQFSFTAGPNEIPKTGMAFSFATMFIQSNDLYYAFEPGGLPLFNDDGSPIGQGSPVDVTGQVNLYDAGTEGDQSPGSGPDQAPRQNELNTGPSGEGSVAEVTDTDGDGSLENDGFSYPATEDVIGVTVESTMDSESGGVEFTVTITNRGTTVNGAPIPLSPGSYAVHWNQKPNGNDVTYPGHAPGAQATGGIEAIAEDGRPAGPVEGDNGTPAGNHVQTLRSITGVTVPLSPGAYAVHSDDVSFFTTGSEAPAGIEAIAEDGRPAGAVEGDDGTPAGNYVRTLMGLDGVKTAGGFGSGPIGPGGSVSFDIEATPGDRLSLATMYIQSNDLFYAFQPEGIALFDDNGQPVGGERTDQVMLYDAGTEGDQEPGVGLDQAPRQDELNTGPSGEGSVTQVDGANDGFEYPAPESIIRVTITPPSSQ
jgi:uncharacterized protein (DUF2141 family)